jgi:hypothetical protein
VTLFIKGSHHRILSVIVIAQNVFDQAPHCRDISQRKIFGSLKNVRDSKQFAYLARQVFPEVSASLCDAYREATQNPHGYMILDFAKDTDNWRRYRTNVFPTECPPIIFPRVKDEVHKIQLSPSTSIQDSKTPITKSHH